MDNLNTHTPASLYEAFPPDEAKREQGEGELAIQHHRRTDQAQKALSIIRWLTEH